MKILLTTLNAKYVHTPLGIWSIYQYCRKQFPGLALSEYNINQDLHWISGEIYSERAEVVAFSCNIWNLAQTLAISHWLKLVAPETIIVLGGPEVWEDPVGLLRDHPWIDQIVVGEGELTFAEWLREYGSTEPRWASILGLVYRSGREIVQNPPRPQIADLNQLAFPYPDDLAPFREKMVYYETSRGCPYHCQYCLSANEHGVRYWDLERVKAELLRFIQAGIGQIKFVDRSFNCHPERAKALWRFLLEQGGQTNFHFEIVAELLDEESLELLAAAPPGLFQVEAGIQSTHPATLTAIQRKMDFEKVSQNIHRLIRRSNVFVHLDLIAGLPGEDYQTFGKTVDDVLQLRPHRLQLGFLKLLHGSGIRQRAAEYGYQYTPEAPYEVLANRWIGYAELLRLKVIEDLLGRYYNSGHFQLSVEWFFQQYRRPFRFFEEFGTWWKSHGLDRIAHKSRDLYQYLLRFYETTSGETKVIRNLLKFDLLKTERMIELPEWTGVGHADLQKLGYTFWQNEANRERYIPDWDGRSIREIQRRVLFVQFEIDPLEADPVTAGQSAMASLYLFVYRGNAVTTHRLEGFR